MLGKIKNKVFYNFSTNLQFRVLHQQYIVKVKYCEQFLSIESDAITSFLTK